MGLPPNARQRFARQHIDDAAKHLAVVEENLFREGQDDRRALKSFTTISRCFQGAP